MKHNFGRAEDILILGAGASVDYGLPTWKELSDLINERISNDKGEHYQYKKEILAWIGKVGVKGGYSTIDECIAKESVSAEYHLNGHQVENQIFQLMKDLFVEVYRANDKGWIRKLNEKILRNQTDFVNELGFINYNYDGVLDSNFLDFTYLPAKHQLLNFKTSLERLSKITIETLHPHGYLFSNQELGPTHIRRHKETMKSTTPGLLDAVSCHESLSHTISNYIGEVKLYILGLGGGLQINLDNIQFESNVNEIHITVRDQTKKDDITKYLSKKYDVPITDIQVHASCDELIEKCF